LNLEPKTKKGDRPLRGRPLTFQDHLVLETESDFRIILRLENAGQAEACRTSHLTFHALRYPASGHMMILCESRHPSP
ncbi:MAG: hypothetical protein WBL61_25005, partial [Bryobacteraceae bacterium]